MRLLKKPGVFIFALFFFTHSYAFVDGTCPVMASSGSVCVPALPGTGWFVANGIGSQNLQYAIGLQNYGRIVSKALVGDPIETIVVPSCFVLTTSCTNPWANSVDPSLDGTQMQVTISSSAGTDGNGDLSFANQSDANYTLVAHPDYCSCGDYNSGGDEYCNSGRVVKSISAGVAYTGSNNPSSPVPPFMPCATGSTAPGTLNNAGFWILNLVSPSGQVPPAGNYGATITVNAQQTT